MTPRLTLYIKPGCPYCARVREVLEKIGLTATEKSRNDDMVAAELVKRGGKRQVPYFVDETRGVEMYESEDIAEYHMKNYSGGAQLAMSKAVGSNVCIPKDFLS